MKPNLLLMTHVIVLFIFGLFSFIFISDPALYAEETIAPAATPGAAKDQSTMPVLAERSEAPEKKENPLSAEADEEEELSPEEETVKTVEAIRQLKTVQNTQKVTRTLRSLKGL